MHGSEFSQGSYGKQESQGELYKSCLAIVLITEFRLIQAYYAIKNLVDFTLLNEPVMCKATATETQSLATTIRYLLCNVRYICRSGDSQSVTSPNHNFYKPTNQLRKKLELDFTQLRQRHSR